MAKESRSFRKQILLFLLIFVLPCIVLVILSIRMIGQERELTQKRAFDERRRLAVEISQHLLNRLESIKLQEVSAESISGEYKNPEVVLLGRVEDNQLKLPWEIEPINNSELQSLNQPDFMVRIQRAEDEELVKKNYSLSARLYRQILRTATTRTQRGYSELLLARVLMKSGQIEEAIAHYKDILSLPSNITDEFRIPVFLYAAGRLTDNAVSVKEVAERIQARLKAANWMSSIESFMIKDICEKLIGTVTDALLKEIVEENLQTAKKHVHKIEQALLLQKDFPGLVLNLQSKQQETVWAAYGDGPWLLSLSPPLFDSKSVLVGVSAMEVLGSLQSESSTAFSYSDDVHFVSDEADEGEYMGPNFRGMRIAFTENQEDTLTKQWSLQRTFYLLALFLVIGVTLFGAYLLWRDVRRDLRLAEMRSQFVSSVSHELKTPLTSIRMFAETLRLRRSKDQKMQDEYLDTIVNESQRLTRLLNNVLDFSKVEKGKRVYKMERNSLPEILQTAARTMEYQLTQQGFELHMQTEEDMPDIRVDGDAIEQALLNLISNAMKYSGDSRDIELKLLKKTDQAVIKVIDQGIGIDPHEQKKIFEKFYRVPSPENERTAGTGLGLSLVSHIVEAHGGCVEVESIKGKGSIFSIFLPLKRVS